MCKPRRITITATRDLQEAWSREVSRTVQLSSSVQGEARVRQRLADSVAVPVLRGIELALGRGLPGWTAAEGGYRHAIDGGYVFYNPEEHEIEIVAVAEGTVAVEGTARTTLGGEVRQTISAEGVGEYYEDGYAGRDEAFGKAEGQKKAEAALAEQAAKSLRQAAEAAEAEAAGDLGGRAAADAQVRLAAEAEKRRAALAQQAAGQLETVGVRGRHVVNRLLAEGYRAAILAYARSNGADGIQCHDDQDTLEIEFMVAR
jgi:hypothetical protein